MTRNISIRLIALSLIGASLTACGAKGQAATPTEAEGTQSTEQAQPKAERSSFHTDFLIYAGDYAAYGDPEALMDIAKERGLTYDTVSSAELDAMSFEQLSDYGTIAWPGGYAGRQSDSLNRETRDKIKRAVNESGVGFIGFCAGAFIAVSPDTTWGLSIVEDKTLDYYHLEDEGTDDSMVMVNMADGTKRDLLWWGGPFTPEWKGGVIARYADDNKPAISQTWAGKGLMILAGPHPEAPEDWRSKLGLEDSDGLDQQIAGDMMVAARNGAPMKAMN